MRILICGGSHADIPQIKAARRLGHWVATSGNNPHELGHMHADAYLPADYSDPAAIREVVARHAIDAVIPCCNDFSYLSCSVIATELGQPGYDRLDTARKIHDKDAFRALCADLGITVPRVLANWPAETAPPTRFDTDVIVKPVDLSGGKGMTRIAAGADSLPAIHHAMARSKAGRVVIEEFIAGSNHGLSALIIEGKVCFSFVDDEHYFLNPYLVSGASSPGIVRPEVTAALIADIELLATHLKLVDGLMHCQFIQTATGYRLLEICRRPPGDLYTRFVELATGIPYPALLVRFYLGDTPAHDELLGGQAPRSITRHCAMPTKNGRYAGLSLHPELHDRIIERFTLLQEGSIITDAQVQKAAILFIDNQQMTSTSGADLPLRIQVLVE